MAVDADMATLARRVGRMKYEQVRALFDENRRKMDAHAEAPDYCPECHWHVEREYARCPEQMAIWKSYRSALEAYPIVEQHKKTCQECQTVLREWENLDSCDAMRRLHDIEQIYRRRMNHLESMGRLQTERPDLYARMRAGEITKRTAVITLFLES